MSTTIGIVLLAIAVIVVLLPTPLDSILVGFLLLLPVAVWVYTRRRRG